MTKDPKPFTGADAFALVKEFFPGLTDSQADDLLWNETGYPSFWNIPEDGNTPQECLRTQLEVVKRRTKKATDG